MIARTQFSIAMLLALPLLAGPLTQGERDRALSEFHGSAKLFLDSIDGLSPSQWNYKPDDRTWSVAECAEHIAVAEGAISRLIKQQIMASPAVAGGKSDLSDEALLKAVTDRSHKAQAPEMLQPKHQWASREELVAAFQTDRENVLEYIRDTPDDLRTHFFKHPAFGTLDGYQWLLLISGHTQRHTQQLLEVKANPLFPKR